MSTSPRRMHLFAAAVSVLAVAAACGSSKSPNSAATPAATPARTLRISSIPDQDPAKLAARDGAMAAALSAKLGVRVEYVPVTDYAASVSLFKTGDLDLVFYGGLTGVQARLQTPGATLLAQRDIDDAFQTVFIANAKSALKPITDVKGLSEYKGTRFTFGSETSTSGRLMPEFFLDQAGVSENDFKGPGGFSGSHDKTIDLVQAGTYDGGALNVQVWNTRKQNGTVDLTKVTEIFTTPSYHDYHWLAGPKTNERFGAGFTDKVKAALLGMAYTNPDDAKVLDLYGAKKFIATQASNYDQVEAIGRKLHLIT